MNENNIIIYKDANGEIKLDMIISLGYRVNSKRATSFRVWATNALVLLYLSSFYLKTICFIKIAAS